MFARRWAGFVSAIWAMLFSGCYTFPNYSTALKEVLGINQKQLNRLSVAKDIGDSCGVLAGILGNYLPAWALLCIGAFVGFVGFGIQWLVVAQIIDPLPYWTMFIAAMLAGNAVSWMNIAVFTVAVRSFPRNRGPVVGLFKACMGLSAAVFSNLCDILFDSSSASIYLLMLMTIPTAFCLITAIVFGPVPPAKTQEDEKAEQDSLLIFNIIASTLAIYIIVQDFVPDLKQGAAKPVALILLLTLLAAPAFVPALLFFRMKERESLKNTKEEVQQEEVVLNSNGEYDINDNLKISYSDHYPADNSTMSTRDIEKDRLGQPLLDNDAASLEKQSKSRRYWICGGSSSSSSIRLGEDWTTLSLFKTWHFYALYFALFCGAGSGMAFTNNLGQVGQALGFSTVTLFTSLFSLGNFLGRIASGNVSEYFVRVVGMPRPAWMGLAKVPMMVLFAWLSMGSGASLYVGSLVLGFCHGSLITLTIPTVSEFYGLKNFGTNFMVTNTHLLAGSYVFSSTIAGYLYDRQATPESDDGSLTCYGSVCYGTTFQVLAVFLTIALAVDALLTFISMPLYRNIKAMIDTTNLAAKPSTDINHQN